MECQKSFFVFFFNHPKFTFTLWWKWGRLVIHQVVTFSLVIWGTFIPGPSPAWDDRDVACMPLSLPKTGTQARPADSSSWRTQKLRVAVPETLSRHTLGPRTLSGGVRVGGPGVEPR